MNEQKSSSAHFGQLDITVTFNEEKFGIEIRFQVKPASNILATLKKEGWRWARFSACWYHRATEGAIYRAATIAALTPEQRNKLEAQVNGRSVQLADQGMEEACGIA